MDADVLVVGAGPTGLMLADQLARRGVKPVIIDRHSGPAQQTRAMAVHARTLEIYAKMGLADAAVAMGARGTGAAMWVEGRYATRVPLGDIGEGLSPYPFVLMLGQDDNERMLGAHLATLGVPIAWNTELVGLTQATDQVEVTLRQPDGSVRAQAFSWVAGCDGARSPVREACGIGFPGAPYEHTFFVADTAAMGPMRPGELNVYLWRDGFHLFFPMRGRDRWRVIGILPDDLRSRSGLTFEMLEPSIRREAGAALDFKSCSWFSTYRIAHRAAERFRDRRCFLLGDAAHIHSPMGGQGMNTGLQDAYNLAWKLAMVVEGRAAPTLLDSYEQERMPVAHRLLETTDRAFQLVVADTWIARLLRTRLLAAVISRVMTFERFRKLAFMTLSQTGIAYPTSALSQTLDGLPDGAPKAGDRFPWLRLELQDGGPPEDLFAALDDTRFHLLLLGRRAAAIGDLGGYGDLLAVHAVGPSPVNQRVLKAAGIVEPSCYLLRPDGHIGLCGREADARTITRYLHEHVGLASGVPVPPTVRSASV